MAIVVLVIDDAALARVHDAATVRQEKFDVVLSEEFEKFLFEQDYSDKAPAAKPLAQAQAQSVDARDAIIAKLIAAGGSLKEPFVFNDLVPLVPEVEAMTKQEQTTLASLFARRFDEGGYIIKLPKVGKNATQYQAVEEDDDSDDKDYA